MGSFQTYRGNPEQKQFYLVDNLIGGINTDFSDDSSPDNEFESIVNFTTDVRGSLKKRKGFGKSDAIYQLFKKFGELPINKGRTNENPNPDDENDKILYIKVLQNDNNCFKELTKFTGDKAYRQYQKIHGRLNNKWEILMITKGITDNENSAWILSCTLPPLIDGSVEDTVIVESEKISIDFDLKWNRNIKNIETIEFFDKIYFTSNNNGLICFDRTKKEFTYSGENLSEENNNAYKPNAMEIRKVGFNVLGNDPLYWVDMQGLVTESIQGMYITSVDTVPLLEVPTGGKFKLNVLYTGADNGFTITFKEGETELSSTATANTELSRPNLKVYDIVLDTVPTSEVEIKIEKTSTTLEPYYDYYQIGVIDPEAKIVETLNIGDHGIVEMYNRAIYYKADTMWFSEINNFNYVPNYNFVTLPLEPTDEITKVVYFKNVYVVFTKYRIYKMMGTFGANDFQLMPLNLDIGCHAPNTIVPIENDLYFASTRGLYRLISSSGYATTNATVENVKEVDTKIKSLTTDSTLYNSFRESPKYQHKGILDNAYAIRYKDKYMLFYNTVYDEEINEENEKRLNDVLVYQYSLKVFSEVKFAIIPTFVFDVDGVLLTYMTAEEKDTYTKERTIVEYDFEDNTTIDENSKTIKDKSINGYDAKYTSGITVSPGDGIILDNTPETVCNLPIINDDLSKGFSVNVQGNINGPSAIVFDLKSSVKVGLANPESFEMLFTKSGYSEKVKIDFFTNPSTENKSNVINYNVYIMRFTGDNRTKANIKVNLSDEKRMSLININENFTIDTSLVNKYQKVYSSSFTIQHDESGVYESNWNASVIFDSYIKYNYWSLGNAVGFDVTQYPTWGSNGFGLRLVGTAAPYNGGCTITYTPYFVMGAGSAISISGARAYNVWINGQYHYHELGALSGSGPKMISVGQQTQNINYTGNPTIFIDAQLNIRANIGGYKENLDIAGFNLTLPLVQYLEGENLIRMDDTHTENIKLNQIKNPSYRNITLRTDEEEKLEIEISSENGKYIESIPDLSLGEIVNIDVECSNIDSNTNQLIIKNNDEIMLESTFNSNLLINTIRDSNILGKNNQSSVYTNFSINSSDSKILEYLINEGEGNVLKDSSGNNNNGYLIGDYTWSIEKGLYFDGNNGYIFMPTFDELIRFGNGFKIQFESKIEDISRSFKIFELSTNITSQDLDYSLANIDCTYQQNEDSLNFSTQNYAVKTYRASSIDPTVENRHKWEFSASYINELDSYDVIVKRDDIEIARQQFQYGGISNDTKRFNYIGKSANSNYENMKGMMYNFKIITNEGQSPVPIYYDSIFEYDKTYSDFDEDMEVSLETKGINIKYPQHIKKLKHLYIKARGGYRYNEFFFEIYGDGHLMNDPKTYRTYIDEEGRVVYDYDDVKELKLNEIESILGSMRMDNTKFGETTYETKKMITPVKAKNFKIKVYGKSADDLTIESFGFVCKLGKVKEG